MPSYDEEEACLLDYITGRLHAMREYAALPRHFRDLDACGVRDEFRARLKTNRRAADLFIRQAAGPRYEDAYRLWAEEDLRVAARRRAPDGFTLGV